jgi:hypothetical protein
MNDYQEFTENDASDKPRATSLSLNYLYEHQSQRIPLSSFYPWTGKEYQRWMNDHGAYLLDDQAGVLDYVGISKSGLWCLAGRLFAHFVGDEKTIYYNLFGKWDRELQKQYVANHTVRLLRVPDLAERVAFEKVLIKKLKPRANRSGR